MSNYTTDYGLAQVVENTQPGVWGITINETIKRFEQMCGGVSEVLVDSPPSGSTWTSGTKTLTWITVDESDSGTSGSEGRSKYVEFKSSSPIGGTVTVEVLGSGSGIHPSRIFIAKNSLADGSNLTLTTGSPSDSTLTIDDGNASFCSVNGDDVANALDKWLITSANLSTAIATDDIVDFSEAPEGFAQIKVSDSQASALGVLEGATSFLDFNTSTGKVSPQVNFKSNEIITGSDGMLISSGSSTVQDLTVNGSLSVSGTSPVTGLPFPFESIVNRVESPGIISGAPGVIVPFPIISVSIGNVFGKRLAPSRVCLIFRGTFGNVLVPGSDIDPSFPDHSIFIRTLGSMSWRITYSNTQPGEPTSDFTTVDIDPSQVKNSQFKMQLGDSSGFASNAFGFGNWAPFTAFGYIDDLEVYPGEVVHNDSVNFIVDWRNENSFTVSGTGQTIPTLFANLQLIVIDFGVSP